MWCETHARPSRASANVFFCSAPTASSGGACSSGNVAGTYPRERRMTCSPRSTESSVRVWIGRSCSRKRSAMPREALERVVVLVGDRLVGDVAAGHHQRHADVGQQQVMQRRVRQHQAELVRARRDRRRHRHVVAADHDRPRRRVRAARPSCAATMTANGRSSRCLRARRRATTASSSARHARWKPPMPLTATIAPSSSARRRRLPAAPTAAARTPGRRSAGRGSGGRAGRRTPPGRPRTCVKPAIVVDGRSYGTPVTIVNRGPQLVQLMNGYR